MAPSNSPALFFRNPGVATIDVAAPTPELRPDAVLVRNLAVALNPTDWKHVDGYADGPRSTKKFDIEGCRVGCDFMGVIEAVGDAVAPAANGREWRVGDRIAGMAYGGHPERPQDGAFGEYTVTAPTMSLRVPDNLSNEEAATLGVGIATVGQGLFQVFGLPLPGTSNQQQKKPDSILIYGGSTATGQLGIQFARLAGVQKIITTASPANFDLVRSLGATDVFDYRSESCASDIRAATNNRLAFTWDCIGESSAPAICAGALSDDSALAPRYLALLPFGVKTVQEINPAVKIEPFYLAYSGFGEGTNKYGVYWPPSTEEADFQRRFWSLTGKLLEDGSLKTVRPIVNRDGHKGLEGVLKGFDELRNNKVSGGKLVYTL